MIPSPHRSTRSGKPVRLIVLHTAEGARTVESLGAWFARRTARASSHAGVDDHRLETYVPYELAAWTLRSGNSISDNLELCGFAAWTHARWLAEHRPMLNLAAAWIKERCAARNIPVRKLTPAQVAAGQAGVCGHHDWTVGMKDGTHTDPGPGFPWDTVMDLAHPNPSPGALPILRYGDRSEDVRKLQQFMIRAFPSYAQFEATGFYGDNTKAAIREFQRRAGVRGSPLDGSIVGPATNYALAEFGYNPLKDR